VSADEDTSRELPAEELARLRETFARIPYVRLLGFEFVRAERGAATFTLDVRDELMRMGGILHGGAVVSLLDTAAAFAVHTVIGADARTVTVDLTVHFLRPASEGRVEATARVLRRGKRICILSVEARDGRAEIVAASTMTYFIQT
jgi:acyl-CoA thioesterase